MDKIVNKIILAKKNLRNKSKDYKKNFQNIENFIKKELEEIKKLKDKSEIIIPEISFKELSNNTSSVKKLIKKRGCIIIRDVFEDDKISELDKIFKLI